MKIRELFVVLTVFFMLFWMSGLVEAAGMPSKFPAFSTKDLDGRAVTDSVFTENEITMINFWATWCPPCVAEMPDLGELAKTLLEDSDRKGALIGILLDVDDRGALEKARQILTKSGADFPILRPSSEMHSMIRAIDAIPTTIFVDSAGNIVGSAVIGARSSQAYLQAMSAAWKEAYE